MKNINWKYAIGELIIVILGITIAFSLNNWKESQAHKRERDQYLNHMAEDIRMEIAQLTENERVVQERIIAIQKLRPFLGNRSPGRDTVVSRFFELAKVISFFPEITTYQALINSGDMKLIDELEMRRSIEEHYTLHSRVLQEYERVSEIHRKYIADFFIYHIDFDQLFRGNTDFMDNPLLKNILASLEGSYRLVSNANAECLKSNASLLLIIGRDEQLPDQ